jgi:hypothetical protein
MVYCAAISGVSAHAIASGGTREASKGDLFVPFQSHSNDDPLA